MKLILPCLVTSLLAFGLSAAYAQEPDSSYMPQRQTLDSLKSELRRINTTYNLFKARTDTATQFTEADRLEIEKLSASLKQISDEIHRMNLGATDLADEAANIYGVKDAIVKEGNYKLPRGRREDTSVKVLNGDAVIEGTLIGSLVVVNGDAFVKDDGKISGDVVVIDGKATISPDAQVEGAIIERNSSDLEKRRSVIEKMKLVDHSDIWQGPNSIFEHLAVSYNRVNGLFLGIGQNKDYFWSGDETYSPYGFFGYGFAIHKWQYRFGFDKWVGNANRFEAGIEAHSLTDSKDYWIIGPKENSLYAILAKEDFLDYFAREGFSAHIGQYYRMNSRVTLSYDVDKYSSLPTNTDWAVFGGHKVFRSNPAISAGWMRSIVLDIQHRNYKGETVRRGWIADLRGEATVSGDFDFRMLTLEAVRYQPLFPGLQLNMRFRGGTSSGVLPLQRSYQIGGLNTLNAYRLMAFTGNRLLLVNAELLFSPRLFERAGFFPLNTFSLILFSDMGQVQSANPSDGMTGGWNLITADNFKSDYGVGLGNGSGDLRIFVSWRTDIATSPTFGVLIVRPF